MARIDPYSQVVLTGLRESTDNDSAVTLQQLNNIPGSGTGPGVTSVRVSEDAFEGNATVTILDPTSTVGNPAQLSILTATTISGRNEGALKLYQVLVGDTTAILPAAGTGLSIAVADNLTIAINGHTQTIPADTVISVVLVTTNNEYAFTLSSATGTFSSIGTSGAQTGLTHVGLADHIITGEITLAATGNADISASGNTITINGDHRVPAWSEDETYQRGDTVRAGSAEDNLVIYNSDTTLGPVATDPTNTQPIVEFETTDFVFGDPGATLYHRLHLEHSFLQVQGLVGFSQSYLILVIM